MTDFVTDADLPSWHRPGCRCALHARRRFSAGLGAAALLGPGAAGAEGVRERVGKNSSFSKIVSAEQIEASARQEYTQMLTQARTKNALAPINHPQAVRLRYIADRIIPHTYAWNERARKWKWEVNLLGSKELNAFCMPGGKIAFYYGILERLQLSDDEVAMIMGHEAAHALREHARERIGKTMATRGAIEIGAALFGLGDLGRAAAGIGGQLLTLTFSREDESEADLVGLELAARAGYDPRAGISLWQKMGAANKGAPPQWLSTHPAGTTRIRELEDAQPLVNGLYAKAAKPSQRFEPAPPLIDRKE